MNLPAISMGSKDLVDEFDKLQSVKKVIEERIEAIREKIINSAQLKNTEILFGTNKICSVKAYAKVIYPENKEQLIRIIKQKGLYEQYSSVNYLKLSSRILKRDIDTEIINLVEKGKAYRVVLKEKST